MGSIWLFLVIIMIIIELLTVNLVTIWVALGALITFLLTYFISNVTIQLIIFFLTTILALILTKPLVKKYIKVNIVKTNASSVIGQTGIVTIDIEPFNYGEVKVSGKYWTAKSDEVIKSGSQVEILAIEGVKLIVRKKEEN